MTRLTTTWLASSVLGFTLGGTAVAETPETPETPQAPAEDRHDPAADTTVPTHEPIHTDIDVDANPPDVPDIYVAPTTDVDTYEDPDTERYGIAVAAGGGTSGFTNDDMRGATDVGGDWGVRMTFGTRSPLAVEGSYIGSAQSIAALGLDDDAMLVGNGVQAALRLNTTIDLPVQPFAFAGAAWRRYDLANTDFNTSDVNDTDNVVEFPVGVGIAGRWQGLILDARGEFRPTIDNDLLPELTASGDTLEDVGNDNSAAMHRWGVNASVGYEF